MTLLRRSDPDDIAAGDFDGYTLVDLLASWRIGEKHRVSVGIENLLDEHYITCFSQTLTGVNADHSNHFAGRGRTVSVRYRWDF